MSLVKPSSTNLDIALEILDILEVYAEAIPVQILCVQLVGYCLMHVEFVSQGSPALIHFTAAMPLLLQTSLTTWESLTLQ